MRLLLFGINYAPELTGIGKYSGELGAFLAERGDEVEVITAPPYYPAWSIRPPYRNAYLKETIDGVTVLRCPLYVPGVQSGAKRILHEVTFVASSLRWWVPRLARRYDAIVAVSPALPPRGPTPAPQGPPRHPRRQSHPGSPGGRRPRSRPA